MSVETLIYAYLAICAFMILFNIACGIVFKYREHDSSIKMTRLKNNILEQIQKGDVDEAHKEYLYKKLIRVNNMVVFENTITELSKEDEYKVYSYIEELSDVFKKLLVKYSNKDVIQNTYFPYLISKYKLFSKGHDVKINSLLIEQLKSPSIYSRENALCAIYSIGDVDNIIKALNIIDASKYYHHRKLISEGLIKNCGDLHILHRKIWTNLDRWKIDTQIAVLDYIRFTTGDMKEEMLTLFSPEYDPEINYCAIRYFGRYKYDLAYEKIVSYLESEDETRWEYKAIAATSIVKYPNVRTEEALKKCLRSPNWYVRLNASNSLRLLGLEYDDLREIFEGEDHFAGDIMRYRMDQRKLIHEEV